jgi:hypothetical protein
MAGRRIAGAILGLLATASVTWAATGYEYLPDANTVGLWHFNEGKGADVTDESATGAEALVEGAAAWDANEDWNSEASGGTAFAFDGATLLAVANEVKDLQPDVITVEAWVYPEDLGGWKLICTHWGGAQVGRYHLGVDAGTPKFHINTSGGGTVFAGAVETLELQTWTHVAGTYDGDDVRLFINGEEVGIAAGGGDLEGVGAGHDVVIGGKASREFQWNGLLDEVRVSDIARNPDELSPNMTGPSAVDPAADSLPVVWGALRAVR